MLFAFLIKGMNKVKIFTNKKKDINIKHEKEVNNTNKTKQIIKNNEYITHELQSSSLCFLCFVVRNICDI